MWGILEARGPKRRGQEAWLAREGLPIEEDMESRGEGRYAKEVVGKA